MRAAVIESFTQPPVYREFDEPASGNTVEVVAAALHPLTRSRATGAHYSSSGILPLVPGMDAVVRDEQGRLCYALVDDDRFGTFAERTSVDPRRCIPLPEGVDAVAVAAAMNPVMASWVALRRRAPLVPGARVLVLGATGSSGSMALRVARRFGAGEVVAAGRNAERLAELDADRTVRLDELATVADVDVVIDFLWGDATAQALVDIVSNRADRSQPLTWIEIGSMAGQTSPIPSAALRACALTMVGSGLGSVSARDFVAELPEIAQAVSAGELSVPVRTVPLAEIGEVWEPSRTWRERVVFLP
ncbi:zinc-binding alcohol dehydrogenase family protein [Microbacterium protaetiae]|uniref:Zinc-binding alcohol dehydrogenase family protein n=1 Tax=Microbacterium protaetiae TaxID=2509458 RepID=A0A4P6EC35_9MICO|nr:zinc-binding alcohol dehydrogenase family protein [Microbacterium protaetiae]QAY58549.1 zinc-binding alcohol dehydrogenase family protein [Microbacterium protaetiae]